MIKRFYYAITGDPNEKVLKKFRPIVAQVGELEPTFERKSNDELRGMTIAFQQRIQAATAELRAELEEAEKEYLEVLGTDEQKFARLEVDRIKKALKEAEQDILWEVLPEAFAAVREASKRATGLRHYDVQLLGGMVLHRGSIAEMKTGEGKTLVATLPLYLNALTGPRRAPGHAQRLSVQVRPAVDGADLPPAGAFCGGDPEQRRQPGRRQFPLRPGLSQRRRPLPVSAPDHPPRSLSGRHHLRHQQRVRLRLSARQHGAGSVAAVQRELHYAIVDEVDNILVDEARTPLIISGESQESSNLYMEFAQLVRRLTPETHYVINEKEMVATLTEEGIAYVERALGVDNLYAPEHFEKMPYLDNALRAHALYRRDKDYIVRGAEVIIVDEFTGRLMEGRRYSEGLHQAIEAKEGVKVQKESMTLATITFQNFFRMYSKLAGMTGTAKTEEEEFQKIYDLDVIQIPTYRPVVREDQDDLVYRTQEGKFKAVIEDIAEKHKAGQPVLVGTVAIETSEYVSQLLDRRGIEHEVLNAKNHEREATIIAQAGRPGAVTIATNMAGRGVDILLGGNAEGLARDQLRREQFELTMIPQADWNRTLDMLKHGQDPTAAFPGQRWVEVLAAKWRETDRDKERVRSLGGLHVVGTERHEARRIDNQLRGRSGRLGDPGSSRFYLSLEDELMRKFGGDRIGPGSWRVWAWTTTCHRGRAGQQSHRERPDQGRGPQLRHPQACAALRRGGQRAAQPHL
jgi:preprotein translocase subunit SecA